MLHTTKMLEDLAIDLIKKEENSYLSKITENWSKFTPEEKKKAIITREEIEKYSYGDI